MASSCLNTAKDRATGRFMNMNETVNIERDNRLTGCHGAPFILRRGGKSMAASYCVAVGADSLRCGHKHCCPDGHASKRVPRRWNYRR